MSDKLSVAFLIRLSIFPKSLKLLVSNLQRDRQPDIWRSSGGHLNELNNTPSSNQQDPPIQQTPLS